MRLSAHLVQPTRNCSHGGEGRAAPPIRDLDAKVGPKPNACYPKSKIDRSCLALLPAGVAWPPALPRAPVVSYTAFSPLPFGSLFLWPDPIGYPIPGIARRRALWSADFPLACKQTSGRPASLSGFMIPFPGWRVNRADPESGQRQPPGANRHNTSRLLQPGQSTTTHAAPARP